MVCDGRISADTEIEIDIECYECQQSLIKIEGKQVADMRSNHKHCMETIDAIADGDFIQIFKVNLYIKGYTPR